MSGEYSIHPASGAERLEAYRIAYEQWNRNETLDAFLERWLNSTKHNAAQRWVLTVDGRVASGLGRYPLEFSYRGRVVPGFGIGEVYTAPAFRRKGYAATLCREVARVAATEGDRIALLFSDIGPAYYAKLGYQVCTAATEFRCSVPSELAASGARVELMPLRPEEHLDNLARSYEGAHKQDQLFLWRNRDYWQYSLRKCPDDVFFAVHRKNGGEPAGYVRLTGHPAELEIAELAICQDDQDLEEATLRAVAAHAKQSNLAIVRGWLRPSKVVKRWFAAAPLAEAIPMVLALADDVKLDPKELTHQCHFWWPDHF